MPKQNGIFSDENYNRGHFQAVQFSATLHMTTPLRVLIHHGEVFNGKPGDAPDYGEQSTFPGDYSPYGIWISYVPPEKRIYKGFEGDEDLAKWKVNRMMNYLRNRHKIDDRYKPATQESLDLYQKHYDRYFRVKVGEDLDMYSDHASDIGPIAPIDYLPFLIDFRKIYESDVSVDQKCSKIFELLEDPRFTELKTRILKSRGEEFPHNLFYSKLTIPGIGWKTSQHLYRNGIHIREDMFDPEKTAKLPDCAATRRALKAIKKYNRNDWSSNSPR